MSKIITGINDLETLCKENKKDYLLIEWDYKKNSEYNPKIMGGNSKIKVWWKCNKGHEWKAVIGDRYANGSRCPFCTNKRVLEGYNDIATTNPELLVDWNYEKNTTVKPTEIGEKSGRKVWWRCNICGHEWEQKVIVRYEGHGCPECSKTKMGKKAAVTRTINNRLVEKHPDIASEWDYEKNTIDINLVGSSSMELVWWKCVHGHSYSSRIASRTRKNGGTGCPYCSNRKVLEGYNDLCTNSPKVAELWNYDKNNELTPRNIAPTSLKKVWWKCNKGHEWEARIVDETTSEAYILCPYCSNRKVLEGYNDLQSVSEELASEWDYGKNSDIPSNVVFSSSKNVWWICRECGNNYQQRVNSRYLRKCGCPICAKKRQAKTFTETLLKTRLSLAENNPELINEWDVEKNGGKTPYNTLAFSRKKAFWLCEFGHSYSATIGNRANGSGCPICNRISTTSFPEQAIFYYIKKVYQDAINGDRDLLKKELDIYIPSKNIAIEYDGYKWHQDERDTKTDIAKNKMCIERNIHLIRIREEGCTYINTDGIDIISCISNDEYSLEQAIKQLFDLLGIKGNINILRDKNEIRNMYLVSRREQSLTVKCPEIAGEWNYDKNKPVTPDKIHYGSNVKYWWKCKEGHEWETKVSSRTKRGNNCPYCAINQDNYLDVWCRNNDENILQEWDYEKNRSIDISKITKGSNKIVYWKCSKGHSYKKAIIEKTKGRGCPYCSGKKVLPGYNDLLTVNPILATEWSEKNTLKPTAVSTHSSRKVLWSCNEGHEWSATIAHRSDGRGCPVCARTKKK